jgi:hypothetical protein
VAPAAWAGDAPEGRRADRRRSVELREVPGDVVRRLVRHHKRELVRVPRPHDQRRGDGQDRPPLAVERLEGVGRHPRSVVHEDQEVAVGLGIAPPALRLGHGLEPLLHLHEAARLRLDARKARACGKDLPRLGRRASRKEHAGRQSGQKARTHRVPLGNLPVRGPDYARAPLFGQRKSRPAHGVGIAEPAPGPVARTAPCPTLRRMVTIEHDFDATVVTLVDEGKAPLQEDVTVTLFEDCVTVEQYDERRDEVVKITLSLAQVRDLGAALNLPEGMYKVSRG